MADTFSCEPHLNLGSLLSRPHLNTSRLEQRPEQNATQTSYDPFTSSLLRSSVDSGAIEASMQDDFDPIVNSFNEEASRRNLQQGAVRPLAPSSSGYRTQSIIQLPSELQFEPLNPNSLYNSTNDLSNSVTQQSIKDCLNKMVEELNNLPQGQDIEQESSNAVRSETCSETSMEDTRNVEALPGLVDDTEADNINMNGRVEIQGNAQLSGPNSFPKKKQSETIIRSDHEATIPNAAMESRSENIGTSADTAMENNMRENRGTTEHLAKENHKYGNTTPCSTIEVRNESVLGDRGDPEGCEASNDHTSQQSNSEAENEYNTEPKQIIQVEGKYTGISLLA